MPPRALTALALTLLAAGAAGAEEVDSPIYLSWARHKVGTTVRLLSVTVQNGQTIRTTTTQELLQVDHDRLIVESVAVTDTGLGKAVQNPPQRLTYRRRFPLLPGVKKEDIGKPDGASEHGEEALTVGGKEYKATWYDTKSQTEAGPSYTRTWMAADVPGKLLKSVTRVPKADKVTTLEVVEVKAP